MLLNIVFIAQLVVTVAVGVYVIYAMKRSRAVAASPAQDARRAPGADAMRELEKLRRMRQISLSEPLAERVRPRTLTDIVGQEEGIRALRAILCGPNPQHVLIYGPPGIGKTCAARLVLEEAKQTPGSPFRPEALFIEMDATCLRFDERAIADPLIGSVHDPIYQGAGLLGMQGIPQPKAGAVTKAHGGVLFLDEIGELHPVQMNKLLKVLEDRRVMLESAYYSADDPAIPRYIHDIFKNGFPADFRLVGATTRSPEEIPPAIRSRCMEVYFRPLSPKEVGGIGVRAANRAGFLMEQAAIERIASYAESGRDAVNVVQVAAGVCQMEGRRTISVEDVDWVLRSGRYAPRHEYSLSGEHRVGVVNGLGVLSTGVGSVMEIEAVALPAAPGTGTIKATGIVEEEETGNMAHRARRRSMAASSMENVRTALLQLGVPLGEYHVHINYPGGIPVDGPSAGLAMGVAVFSAVSGRAVRGDVAMTGEMTARGEVRAVGGVPVKAAAAAHAGAQVVLIPQENLQTGLCAAGARIVAVSTLSEALPIALCDADAARPIPAAASAPAASPPLAPALAAHTAQPAHPPA